MPRSIGIAAALGAPAGVLIAAIFQLAARRSVPLHLAGWWLLYASIAGAIFSVSFYVTCGLPQAWLRDATADLPVSVRRVIQIAAGVVGGTTGIVVAFWGVGHVPGLQVRLPAQMPLIMLIDGVIGGVLAYVIFAIMQVRQHARRNADALLKARLTALQAQIYPHFFFNSLNTVSALVTLNPPAAQELIGRMADMFRYTMRSSQDELVTLDDELTFVENYLRLEQMRFADRLRVEMPERRFSDIRLPGLTLQPIVENAIRHGIAQRLEGGTVRVSVERNGVTCTVGVCNTCDSVDDVDLSEAHVFRPGHALDNIRERLRLYAGGRAAIRLEKDGADAVRVSLEIPVIP